MGKSAKKRRLKEKRRKELERLRGISLLDAASPGPKDKQKSGQPSKTSVENGNHHAAAISDGLSRPRVEFVLPRVLGKAETYVFDKQAKAMSNKDLPTIPEEMDSESQKAVKQKDESIDDILFPKKRRKLEIELMNQKVAPAMVKNKAIIQGGRFMLTQVSSVENLETPPETNGLEQTKNSIKSVMENSTKLNKKRRRNSSEGDINLDNHGHLSGRSVEEAVKDKYGLRPRANSTDGELNLPQRGLCDERMVLEAHRWNNNESYVHQLTPKGFVNLGNTCFLNSTLQCLAYLPPFCQSLLAISEIKLKNQRNLKKKLSQGQKITSSLGSLFQRIHGFHENDRDGAIAPQNMVRALPTIGTCGSRNGYKFRPGRQEDAHEFLVHLLDAMHDGELRGAGINQQLSGWRDRLPVARLDETTFIHRVFGGYFRSQVRCRQCGYRSNTYDPFLDLSLEVSKKGSNSVLHSLSEFTKKETLDSDNQWRCSGCKRHVCATKQLTVFRPPLSLCIQLKRFTFDGFGGRSFSSYGTGGWKYGKSNNNFRGGGKITKPIEFPAELDLPLSDSRSCEYTLTGLVIHVGGSASSGHYTAYVKKPGRKGANQWYHVDDSFVEPVSEKTVLRQKDAYLLFYCRKEVKLEFPSPPSRGMSAEEATKVGRARAKARADSIGKEEANKVPPIKEGGEDERGVDHAKVEKRESLGSASSRDLERTKTTIHPLASPLQSHDVKEKADLIKAKESSSSGSETSSSSDGSSKSGNSEASSRSKSSSEDSSDSSSESLSSEEKIVSKDSKSNKVDQTHSSSDSASSSDEEDSSSSEEGSSSSEEDSSSDSTSDKEETSTKTESTLSHSTSMSASVKSDDKHRTRIVVSNKESRGKIEYMLGPRKKKRAWKTKATTIGAKGVQYELLGNMSVNKWGDEEESNPDTSMAPEEVTDVSLERGNIVENINKQEKSRKRKLFLDRWDSHLDQGKVKKTKKDKEKNSFASGQVPKNNVFQRIQTGLQKMNKGKPKGFTRRKGKYSGNSRASF